MPDPRDKPATGLVHKDAIVAARRPRGESWIAHGRLSRFHRKFGLGPLTNSPETTSELRNFRVLLRPLPEATDPLGRRRIVLLVRHFPARFLAVTAG